jgi:hypothetical protein
MTPVDVVLAPMVVALRLPYLWWEAFGGNAFGRRESTVMVTEKLEALRRGAAAAQVEAVHVAFDAALAAARLKPQQSAELLLSGPQRIANAALRPAARRVRANVKRLGGG